MAKDDESVRIVLRGGTVVDAGTRRRADVAVRQGAVVAVGEVAPQAGDRVIDCADRLIMPGFIDTHSHTDGLLADEGVQRSLLRQGVTTVVTGQDGVSYAPGDGSYATEYFAAINGDHPTYRGGGVADYLAAGDGSSRVNVAYAIPAGTVRHEVCGREQGDATADQIAAMVGLVEQSMRDGAVGLSTGLDYVPGIFQGAAEIAALCEPVARAGGVYASHMRGGYESNAAVGVAEIVEIAQRVHERTGHALDVHVSHFHADADIVLGQLDRFEAAGVDATFDAYPYIRGCSLLGMPLLPPELSVRSVDEVVAVLRDPDERERLRAEWMPHVANNPSLGPDWPHMITFAHIAAPEYAWAHGLTIADAAGRAGTDPAGFAFDVLAASRLEVNEVMAVRNPRPVSELARIFAHPRHMGGSDGIFIGAHPHPRARGTFACYLREYVRETATWSWQDAAQHLSATPAARFGLGRRGKVEVGAVADLIVVDPGIVADTATYEKPRGDAVGIDDVLVAGVPVLVGGELAAGADAGGHPIASDAGLAGRGLRREADGGTGRPCRRA